MAVIRGIKLPLELDSKGNLAVVEDVDLIRQHIICYLSTIKTERLGRPNYGIKDYLWGIPLSVGKISSEIENELTATIPQAEFVVTSEINDRGELLLNVFWSYLNVEQEPFEVTFLQS